MSDNSRVRVSLVGVVIVALFGSLLARLWFLQVGPEQSTLGALSVSLTTRQVRNDMPRGRILDRNGVVLAQDRAAWAVTVSRDLDEEAREKILGQLSELLGIPQKTLQERFDSVQQSVLKPAVVALDVPLDKRIVLKERQDDYPGVNLEELTVRTYPQDRLAAQTIGYTGEIDAEQLKKLKARGYVAGDSIGRAGIEAAYEKQLRGTPEQQTVQVDPTGKQVGEPIETIAGTPGDDVVLTIDSRVQRVAEQALAQGIASARTRQNKDVKNKYETFKATEGAVVVLDVRDGSVAAMASYPDYSLKLWEGGITTQQFQILNSDLAGHPLVNRATEGGYAPGSTFKLVTGLATPRYGMRSIGEYYDDNGFVYIGADRQKRSNDNGVVNGPVNLTQALMVSSDTYFYTAGEQFYFALQRGETDRGLGLQTQARELGFGATTGIELGEAQTLIPTPDWKRKFAQSYYKTKQQRDENSTWYPGDDVNLAVGQGDVLVTPLQLANAYACFANNGTLLTPHVGKEIRAPGSPKVLSKISPAPRGRLQFDQGTWAAMRQGFREVVENEDGTAHAAFSGFNVPVAGKTGTAQVAGKGPTSLFASWFPADSPQYAVVAVVKEGGHGADTAAPIVRRVIDAIANPTNPFAGFPVVTGTTGRD
jgi:penicillin-binding protein 2